MDKEQFARDLCAVYTRFAAQGCDGNWLALHAIGIMAKIIAVEYGRAQAAAIMRRSADLIEYGGEADDLANIEGMTRQ